MMDRVWDATRYDEAHSFVWRRASDLVDELAPQAGERILDLGCGTGRLTAHIAASGADIVGVDLSEDMIRQASMQVPDVEFRVADARGLPFRCEFDAVFSNAVLHWALPPEAVADSIWRSLKPGGRFVAEFGGARNIAAILGAVRLALDDLDASSPLPVRRPSLYFPTIGEYAALLEARGFRVAEARLFERPTPLDGGQDGMRSWLTMFGGDYLSPLSAEDRERVIAAVEETAKGELYRNGEWVADYWRLRVEAWKDSSPPER